MVLLSGRLLTSTMRWDPVIAMSFEACSVNSAGAVRTSDTHSTRLSSGGLSGEVAAEALVVGLVARSAVAPGLLGISGEQWSADLSKRGLSQIPQPPAACLCAGRMSGRRTREMTPEGTSHDHPCGRTTQHPVDAIGLPGVVASEAALGSDGYIAPWMSGTLSSGCQKPSNSAVIGQARTLHPVIRVLFECS